jgi:hypothetical protein
MGALVSNRDNVTTTRAAGSLIGVHEPNRKPRHHRNGKVETSWMGLLARLTPAKSGDCGLGSSEYRRKRRGLHPQILQFCCCGGLREPPTVIKI